MSRGIQKKPFGGFSKVHFRHMTVQPTEKQIRYVKARYMEGKTQEQAKAEAGYAPSRKATDIEVSPAVQYLMERALENIGVTPELIAIKIKDGLDAMKPIVAGRQITDYPDYQARGKYVDTYLDVTGARKPKGVDVTSKGEAVTGYSVQFIDSENDKKPESNEYSEKDTSSEG